MSNSLIRAQGTYGKVVGSKSSGIVTKTVDISDADVIEPVILMSIDHPNVIKLLGMSLDTDKSSSGTIYGNVIYTMPFLDYTLYNYNGDNYRDVFFQLCSAYKDLNDANIYHCDIKPANMMISYTNKIMTPMIIDFGLAKYTFLKSNEVHSIEYTRYYRAPELVKSNLYKHINFNKTEVYAMGMSILDVILPYVSQDINDPLTMADIFQTIQYNMTYDDQDLLKELRDDINTYDMMSHEVFSDYLNEGAIMDTIRDLLSNIDSIKHLNKQQKYDFTDLLDLVLGMIDPIPSSRLDWNDVLTHPYFSNYGYEYQNRLKMTSMIVPTSNELSSIKVSVPIVLSRNPNISLIDRKYIGYCGSKLYDNINLSYMSKLDENNKITISDCMILYIIVLMGSLLAEAIKENNRIKAIFLVSNLFNREYKTILPILP